MLQIDHVSIEFPVKNGSIRPVDNVCLTVGEGTRHIIIGETGSGKSVLLMAVLGLSGGAVSGSIRLDGKELLTLSEKEFSRLRGSRISYIPQGNAGGLNPLHRIGAQIGEPLRVHAGLSRREAFSRAEQALKRLDFPNPGFWARRYPHNLSGGMKQRALVAMGTAAGSRLLLADEPTKGLDGERREEVARLFSSLGGASLLCVTHDLSFARRTADFISVMYAGQIVETADKDTFFRTPAHPYSQMLIQSLPENGFCFPPGFAPSHEDYQNIGCRFSARCPRAEKRCRKIPPVTADHERQVQCWNYADGKKSE